MLWGVVILAAIAGSVWLLVRMFSSTEPSPNELVHQYLQELPSETAAAIAHGLADDVGDLASHDDAREYLLRHYLTAGVFDERVVGIIRAEAWPRRVIELLAGGVVSFVEARTIATNGYPDYLLLLLEQASLTYQETERVRADVGLAQACLDLSTPYRPVCFQSLIPAMLRGVLSVEDCFRVHAGVLSKGLPEIIVRVMNGNPDREVEKNLKTRERRELIWYATDPISSRRRVALRAVFDDGLLQSWEESDVSIEFKNPVSFAQLIGALEYAPHIDSWGLPALLNQAEYESRATLEQPQCGNCGAALDISALVSVRTCPYCGADAASRAPSGSATVTRPG